MRSSEWMIRRRENDERKETRAKDEKIMITTPTLKPVAGAKGLWYTRVQIFYWQWDAEFRAK